MTAKSNHQEKFTRLREEFPVFTYELFEYSLDGKGLQMRFLFRMGEKYSFTPSLVIPRRQFFREDDRILPFLPVLVFHIGLIELISYWKAACPPRLVIKPAGLSPEQVKWWKKVWFNGLGEFFYLNGIRTDEESFMTVECPSGFTYSPFTFSPQPSPVIPVGGGKDSVVTLELLGSVKGSLPLILNPRGASLKTVLVRGFEETDIFEVRRTLDPVLPELNDMGFLNGHTPFSALLAFITALASVVAGRKHIALSNESSASEATIPGTRINHQYSKSLEFETDFREYTRKFLSPEINYFSFLRPLNELQIGMLFSRYPRYFDIFRSCNAGIKTDSWCGKCSKCLFTAIILAPFLPSTVLRRIFGKDMLADEGLVPLFDQLTGIAEEKPFECVGTVDEVNEALSDLVRGNSGEPLPFLLSYYLEKRGLKGVPGIETLSNYVFSIEPGHYLPDEYFSILKKAIHG